MEPLMMNLMLMLLAAVGLWLYKNFKPESHPSLLLDRDHAHELACRFVHKYVGVDVCKWKYYAMYWHDRDLVNKLHHIGLLNSVRGIMYKWGLVEAWRIRFIDENKSVMVGINAGGDITFLQVDIRQRDLPRQEGGVQSPECLMEEMAATNGIWADMKLAGEGKTELDLNNIHTYWYVLESERVRMRLTVQTQNGYVHAIGSQQEIDTDQMDQAVRKEYVESTLNMSGVIGSFIAVIAAILSIITLNLGAELAISVLFGTIMAAASMLTVKEDIRLSIVNAYDARISVKMVYVLGILSALLASLASGFVAFICTLAGKPISEKLGIRFLEHTGSQLLAGACIGLACLGVFALFYHVLQRKGIVRISPELSDRTVYMSGFNVKQGLSVSLQSSIAEEVVYRLLTIPVVLLLTENALVAVLVSSVLWAFLHQGTGYHPRGIRWLQLVIFGVVLGFVYLHYGFLAVLTAHFVHNLVLVSMPLIQHKLEEKQAAVKQRMQSSF